MARTPGSGWGAGPLTYYYCPSCKRKKVIKKYLYGINRSGYQCSTCREWFYSLENEK